LKTRINLRELKLRRLRFKRITYRSALILLGIVAMVILAFNFWFIDHAKDALEQIVYNQSKGKLRLKVSKFKFNWVTNKIELENASIHSTDTTAATSYSVNTERISIKARGFLPLLIKKEILIDSIRLTAPNVIFTRHAPKKHTLKHKDTTVDNSFSVAQEMGRISNSITQVINVLEVDKFRLDSGSFSLVNKTKPHETPFTVTNIYIQLDHLQFDKVNTSKKAQEKISFTENIAVRTHDQSIVFPGGRHFIAFKDFRVNLQNKRVEFDSCTLRAIKGDSSQTSFRIFFDKLQLTNINFDSLYSTETIIADSVFCDSPEIYLDIDSDVKKHVVKKEKKKRVERIDALMQQLLGDIKLNYVGVKEAAIHVNTIKKGVTNTFSASDNNFEIYDLLVKHDEEKPIRLRKFVMSLHDYETSLSDGRYAIAFDSIGFEDDLINLSKFSFKEFHKGKTVKSLAMPTFQVRGLSWESLLYENIFSANSANFINPIVDYTITRRKQKARSGNLFETLNSVDDVMDLKNLRIENGEITLRLSRGGILSLHNANLDLRANELTSANRIKSVQRSVNALHFEKGIFKKGALTAQLTNVNLSENKSGLTASSLILQSKDIDAKANHISLGTVILDSATNSIVIDGVKWANASLVMNPSEHSLHQKSKSQRKATSIVLRNIHTSNTHLDVALKQHTISGKLNTLLLKQFVKNEAGKPEIRGMSVDGNDLLFTGPDIRVSVDKMDIVDNQHSVLTNIQLSKINNKDSILATIPRFAIIPNITEFISGDLKLRGIEITDPIIHAKLGRKDSTTSTEKKQAPQIVIGSAFIQRPDIKISFQDKQNAFSHVSWDGKRENSYLKLTNLKSTDEIPVKADQIKMFLTHFEFVNAKGKKTATNDNKLNLEFNDVVVEKNKDKLIDWRTNVNILSLDRLYFDSLGKNNAELMLDKGDVHNIVLNSKYIKNIGSVIANSANLQVNAVSGSFLTGKNELYWHGFAVQDQMFSVDSVYFTPKQSVEAYRISKAFNEDYLRVRTGKISGGPVDMEKYGNDSILNVGSIALNDVNLFTFKDKTQPDTVVKYKPLPAEMLLHLKNSLHIDSIRLKNMQVTYWEINPNTDTLGVVTVADLNTVISNIKNYNIQPDDSIYILATARILDQLPATLQVSQSYSDTTGYMRMQLNAGSMDLAHFNTVLVPLVAAKVFDGHLNSLNIQAVGTNEAAAGIARMNYRGLNVGLLNKKDLPNQTFLNKLISRIAMILVVRRNNSNKASLVFFERWQDKSPINYIIKTSLEGIKSSIGLPGAKKKLRKYNRKAVSHQKIDNPLKK